MQCFSISVLIRLVKDCYCAGDPPDEDRPTHESRSAGRQTPSRHHTIITHTGHKHHTPNQKAQPQSIPFPQSRYRTSIVTNPIPPPHSKQCNSPTRRQITPPQIRASPSPTKTETSTLAANQPTPPLRMKNSNKSTTAENSDIKNLTRKHSVCPLVCAKKCLQRSRSASHSGTKVVGSITDVTART